jgi:hypothetical protein
MDETPDPPAKREPELHFGLDLAQAIAVTQKTNLELALEWAENGIRNFRIQLRSKNYDVLLQGAEVFELTDMMERQQYFHFIFAECLKNASPEVPAQGHHFLTQH